jgi:hypothetical protein
MQMRGKLWSQRALARDGPEHRRHGLHACIVHQDVHSAPLVHRRADAALWEVVRRHVACQRGRVAAVALDGLRHLQSGGEGSVCQP